MKVNKQVRRFDLGEIKSATRTPQGFLLCPGFATRVGVFPYLNADGSVRHELRHPDDVFDPVSLETLKHAPFTLEHPPEMITPKNVAKYRKGHSTDRVEVNRDMVDTDIIIEDQDAIDAVEKGGIRELSSGYTADVEEEAGVWNGIPYDCRQKNIRYNHIAGVKRGRAGPEVRLRMDSQDAVMQDKDFPVPAGNTFSQSSGVMDADLAAKGTKKVVILGREVDLPSDVADTVQDMLDRFDEMRAKTADLEESMSKKAKIRKDEDINQPGVSPQVDVEQGIEDGRSVSGKTPPKPGSETGRQDDEEIEDGDEDGDDKAKNDDEPASEKGGGAAESGIDKLKKDMDEKQAKHDEDMANMKKKMDAFAAASMDKPEKNGAKMDSAEIQKIARARGKLERMAEKLVPASVSKRFDSMSDEEIHKAAIKHSHPKADLDGKSTTYLQTRFDSLSEALEDSGSAQRQDAGKAFLGLGSGRFDSEEKPSDPDSARRKMVQDGREMHKQNLSRFRS